MLRILEHPTGIPRPVSMIFAYPALDFNFTSWMSPTNLRVLRTEQSEVNIPGIMHGKDHMRHKSPLSVVDDVQQRRTRQKSWSQAFGKLALSPMADKRENNPLSPGAKGRTKSLSRTMSTKVINWLAPDLIPKDNGDVSTGDDNTSETSDSDDDTETVKDGRSDAEKSLRERVKTPKAEQSKFELPPMTEAAVTAGVQADFTEGGQVKKRRKKAPIGTRLTMTSRVGYFQDRIISPSMVSEEDDSARSHADVRCAQWQYCTSVLDGVPTLRPIITSLLSSRRRICWHISRQYTSSVASEIRSSTTLLYSPGKSARPSEPVECRRKRLLPSLPNSARVFA